MMLQKRAEHERAVIELVVPGLEAEGFEVFVAPSGLLLPAFLRGHAPDAIAVKDGRKVAVAVIGAATSGDRIERLKEILAAQPGWDLRVIYAPPREFDLPLPILSPETIDEQLRRVQAVEAPDTSSLLLAWSAFEAAARHATGGRLLRPQPPAALIETLAFDGAITADEADMLRAIAARRNRAAHGDLDITVSREDLLALIRISRILLALDPEPSRAA